MRVLLQRVARASVVVEGREVSSVGRGLLALVGVGVRDEEKDAEWAAGKVAGLRIFEDNGGKMNLGLAETGGEILSVSQFTLYADTRRGRRPGFEEAAGPEKAQALWRRLNDLLRRRGLPVKEGVFGAYMEISLLNDGPVTILLDSEKDAGPA